MTLVSRTRNRLLNFGTGDSELSWLRGSSLICFMFYVTFGFKISFFGRITPEIYQLILKNAYFFCRE